MSQRVINILYSLINVTKIVECYSAINRLQKLIIEKDAFLCSKIFVWPESCIFLPFDDVVYDSCQHYKLRTHILHFTQLQSCLWVRYLTTWARR